MQTTFVLIFLSVFFLCLLEFIVDLSLIWNCYRWIHFLFLLVLSFFFVICCFFTSRGGPVRTPFDWWPYRRADRGTRIYRALRAASEVVSRDCWARILNCGGSSDCTGRRWAPRGRASTYRGNSPVTIRFRCASETPFRHLLRHLLLRLPPPHLGRLGRLGRRCRRRHLLLLVSANGRHRPPSAAPLGTSAIFRIEIPTSTVNKNIEFNSIELINWELT